MSSGCSAFSEQRAGTGGAFKSTPAALSPMFDNASKAQYRSRASEPRQPEGDPAALRLLRPAGAGRSNGTTYVQSRAQPVTTNGTTCVQLRALTGTTNGTT